MKEFIQFWLAKHIVELMIPLFIFAWIFIVSLRTAWRQARCKHTSGVNETRACDAICRACGKNLGFIGTWRKEQRIKDGAS